MFKIGLTMYPASHCKIWDVDHCVSEEKTGTNVIEEDEKEGSI